MIQKVNHLTPLKIYIQFEIILKDNAKFPYNLIKSF